MDCDTPYFNPPVPIEILQGISHQGRCDDDVADFNEMPEPTWCEDRINDNDVEYTSATNLVVRRLKRNEKYKM